MYYWGYNIIKNKYSINMAYNNIVANIEIKKKTILKSTTYLIKQLHT